MRMPAGPLRIVFACALLAAMTASAWLISKALVWLMLPD
jgi:hypothetical protein